MALPVIAAGGGLDYGASRNDEAGRPLTDSPSLLLGNGEGAGG